MDSSNNNIRTGGLVLGALRPESLRKRLEARLEMQLAAASGDLSCHLRCKAGFGRARSLVL